MNFLRRHKFIIITIILFGCFILINPALATGVGDATASIVGNIVKGLVFILGKVLVVLMYILIWVCSYNGFVTSAAVTNGWVILRDVCNMFFILILLVIAFATVLNIEGYSWKKLLPKMLLMAVLINFSKLICGFIIDFAQVIMLTFVNGFRDIGGGNLSDMLGINELLAINGQGDETITMLSIMGTYVLALGYVIVAIGVIVIILFVLVMRMVMLWILVTLSPLAYLLGALPNTSKYASKWLSQFIENVVSGPILAFFIWLSFASATADVKVIQEAPRPEKSATDETYFKETSLGAGLSTAGTPDGMLKFIISIGMLIGGVIITKDLGGAAAKAVSQGMSVNNWARKKTTNAAANAGKAIGKTSAQVGLRSAGSLTTLTGKGISKISGGYLGEVTQKRGQFMSGWGKDIQKTQKDAATAKKLKTLNKFGIKEQGLKGLQEYEKASFGGQMTAAALSGSPMEMYQAAVVRTWPMKMMGGKLKDFSTKYQEKTEEKRKHKNIIETAQAVHDLETKSTKEKGDSYEKLTEERDHNIKLTEKSRDEKLHNYDVNEAADLEDAKNRFLAERTAMEMKGATSGELEQHGRQYKTEMDGISDRYNNLREKVKAEAETAIQKFNLKHETSVSDAEAKINLVYQDKINLARDYHAQAKKVPRQDTELKTASEKKDQDLANNEAERKIKLEEVKNLYKASPAIIEAETKKINSEHDKKTEEINKQHTDKTKEIHDYYHQTSNREFELKAAEKEKDQQLGQNEDARKKAIEAATSSADSPTSAAAQVKKINEAYDKKAQEINQQHGEKTKTIADYYNSRGPMPIDGSPAVITKWLDKAGNALEQYDPLELTNAAIKKGLEAMRQAAEIFSGIGFKKLGELSKSDFTRGARGLDETTTRVWKMLAKGDAESLEKLKQMTEQLREIKSQPDGPTTKEKTVINAMKEGLGVFLRDNPGSKSTFTVYIESLDKIDTGKKVDDYTKGAGGYKEKK